MDIVKAKKFANELQSRIPAKFVYHSNKHTGYVIKYSAVFAEKSGVESCYLPLIETAAAFHDTGYVAGNNDHEEQSAKIAADYLPKFGYRKNEIDTICGLIRATKLPVSPQNLPEMIMCDADVEYLGRAEFFTMAPLLRLEIALTWRNFNELEWLDFEIKFMKNLKFFSPAAKAMRSQGMAKNLKIMEQYRELFDK